LEVDVTAAGSQQQRLVAAACGYGLSYWQMMTSLSTQRLYPSINN